MSQSSWARPLVDINTLGPTIDVLLTHATYTMVPGDNMYSRVEMRLWCVTAAGGSVLCRVHDYEPYFFIVLSQSSTVTATDVRIALRDKLYAVYSKSIPKNSTEQDYCTNLVTGVTVVYKTPLMGLVLKPKKMFRITVRRPQVLTMAIDLFENGAIFEGVCVPTYEAKIGYVTRFLTDANISGCQWLRVPTAGIVCDYMAQISNCGMEIITDVADIEPLSISDHSSLDGMRILTFDIECTRTVGPGFPQPETDMVSQVGIAVRQVGVPQYIDRVVFCVVPENQSVDPLPDGVRTLAYEEEAEMFDDLGSYFRTVDPDVFTGYNIDGFDWRYLFERARAIDAVDGFAKFHRLCDRKATLKKAHFQSKAFGAREDFKCLCDRVSFDMFKYVSREKKLRSYGLNAVATTFLGHSKVEMPYKLIPVYQNGTDAQRAHLCYYCYIDAELCIQLMDVLMALVNGAEQCRVTGVPLDYLLSRGAQIKTLSNLLQLTRAKGYVIPSTSDVQNDEKTKGATVLDPTRGFHTDPVCTLDFASLYPNIMRQYNICYTTKADRKWAESHLGSNDYYVPKNLHKCKFVFVKKHIRAGILPEILETLLNARKQAKADLKAAKDPMRRSVLDGRQLALKIVCNSVYGFVKANTVCDKDLMEAVTGWGRWMIDQSKRISEEEFGQQVVYGDSVTHDTPCLLYNVDTGSHFVDTIQTLIEGDWEIRGDGKQVGRVSRNTLVWTDTGWTAIKQIIRHRVEKKVYRVLTHTGVVDVTEDHSLLNSKAEKISAVDCTVNKTLLLHSYPQTTNVVGDEYRGKFDVAPKTAEEAMAWGLFMADGSCGEYECKSGKKISWAINNTNMRYLLDAKKALDDAESNVKFKVLDTLKSSGVYKLVPSGKVAALVRRYRPLFYDQERYKIVPTCILNAPLPIRKAFWKGYYRGDGDKDPKGYTRADAKGKIGVATLYYLMRSLGYNVSINTRKDKLHVYRLTGTFKTQRKVANKIKKIDNVTDLYKDQYVYDLETANHHFQAGVGQMIVHNTDSVMVKMPGKSMTETFEIGARIATAATEFFGPPQVLELEKVYHPYLLIGKKKYAGRKYEYADQVPTLASSGLENVRRDNAPIGSETLQRCLELLLMQGDPDAAIAYVHQKIRLLLTNRIDMRELIISRGLSKTKKHYEESTSRQAHAELAKRIAARAATSGESIPHTGDRVKYVMTAGTKKDKVYELAESPIYAMKHGIPIDTKYYINKQMMKPLVKIFTPVIAPSEMTFKYNKSGERADLTDNQWQALTAYKVLFTGDHTLVRREVTVEGSTHGIVGFTLRRKRCIGPGCNAALHKMSSSPLCASCVKDEPTIIMQTTRDLTAAQRQYHACWTRCQRCIGSSLVAVECGNLDCDNFFKRDTARAEMMRLQTQIDEW